MNALSSQPWKFSPFKSFESTLGGLYSHAHIYLFTVVFIAPLLGTFSSYPAKYCWNYFPCSSHLQVCFIIYSSGFGYKSHVHKFQQTSPENEAHSQTVGKPVPQWAVLDFQLSSAAAAAQCGASLWKRFPSETVNQTHSNFGDEVEVKPEDVILKQCEPEPDISGCSSKAALTHERCCSLV